MPNPKEQPAQPVLADAFKQAMRRLAATVTIITTAEGLRRHGMTATAVNSVTTSPPTLLVCVNRSASIHEPLMLGSRFCVNFLAHDHSDLVPLFSGKAAGEERFSNGTWATNQDGLPFLQGAQANLFCNKANCIQHGSHSIIIGEVYDVQIFGETSPLIYQEGQLFRTTLFTP
jgi:flavin reductase (DIM6/NTAB) family NADH-FMN oxidoreductase RutF